MFLSEGGISVDSGTAKARADSLTLIGIRILAENDHANFLEGAVLESAEYILLNRVNTLASPSKGSYPSQYVSALSALEYRLPAAAALHANLPVDVADPF